MAADLPPPTAPTRILITPARPGVALQHRRVTSGSGIHTLAPKDLEIASQKQSATGHGWHGSLLACNPLPRARERVWWAVRGRNQILRLLPDIDKHPSFQSSDGTGDNPQDLRYCHPEKRWYVFDGQRWVCPCRWHHLATKRPLTYTRKLRENQVIASAEDKKVHRRFNARVGGAVPALPDGLGAASEPPAALRSRLPAYVA